MTTGASCNVGRKDRTARIILGFGIAAAGVHYRSWWGLLALAFLHNGIFGHCYFYEMLRISTNRAPKARFELRKRNE